MHNRIEQFKSRFKFKPENTGLIGVERECFIADAHWRVVPEAALVMERLRETVHGDRFSYELSACQVESKTFPTPRELVDDELDPIDQTLEEVLRDLNLRAIHYEVGPEDMPLDVAPWERYRQIKSNMTREQLLAACRIIATHVHIGMRDHAMALRVYNRVLERTPELIVEGDGSKGERMRIYGTVAPKYEPRPYADWGAFYKDAVEGEFANDPRRNWQIVRISPHGSIEFRVFGTTANPMKAGYWARMCHDYCMEVM